MVAKSGRHFLQIPGPTNVPDRILRAIAQPTIDHRGPEFASLGREVLDGIRSVFKTSAPVVMFPGSGTGAWEASLVNTLSPGDKVLMFETGQFATLWKDVAARFGLDVEFVPGDWRHGVDPGAMEWSQLQFPDLFAPEDKERIADRYDWLYVYTNPPDSVEGFSAELPRLPDNAL